jgi:TRAP-type C4-dicarboxylate transport system permease small subunit
MKKFGEILDRIFSTLNGLGALLILVIVVEVCVHVLFRYFLKSPINWTVQFTEYSLLVVVFLGAAWLLRLDGHVAIDIIVLRLRPKGQNIVNFLTSLICSLASAIIVYYGIKTCVDLAIKGTLVMDNYQIPKFLLAGLIPGTFFLLLIQFVRRTYGFYRQWRPGVSKDSQKKAEIAVAK